MVLGNITALGLLNKCLTNLLIGGSMVGLGNILAIRQIVDFWSTLPLRNKTPNVHVLLGKSQDLGKSPGVYLFHSPTLLQSR